MLGRILAQEGPWQREVLAPALGLVGWVLAQEQEAQAAYKSAQEAVAYAEDRGHTSNLWELVQVV